MDTMPIDIPRQAGIYVRRAREAKGMTRAELAQASGVSVRLLAALELGDATGIRLDKLLAVFGALEISLLAQAEHIARQPGAAPTAASSAVLASSSSDTTTASATFNSNTSAHGTAKTVCTTARATPPTQHGTARLSSARRTPALCRATMQPHKDSGLPSVQSYDALLLDFLVNDTDVVPAQGAERTGSLTGR